jgi:hypothetical protein
MNGHQSPDWQERLRSREGLLTQQGADKYYLAANIKTIQAVLSVGDSGATRSGLCLVYNMSSADIPAFVLASRKSDEKKPYKNAYDMADIGLGVRGPGVSLTRKRVDDALPVQPGSDIYFGAVELNGPGMRFYGDFCLVLKRVDQNELTVLDRDSYFLEYPPVSDRIRRALSPHNERKMEAKSMSGKWNPDLNSIVTIKVLGGHLPPDRILTTDRISDAVLSDEDYIEVLRQKSFGTCDLLENRVNAADAALETLIGDNLASRRCPTFQELLWRKRRRDAVTFLRAEGIPTRVITTTGRVKS